MGSREIETFLTHLAVDEHVAPSTQNQAFHALLFLYREILKQELDNGLKSLLVRQTLFNDAVTIPLPIRSVNRKAGGTIEMQQHPKKLLD